NSAWGWPKLADFGLARPAEGGSGLTASRAVVGTPGYMAPEQAEGRSDVGPPADVWALGAILYRLLTGVQPFRGKNSVEVLYRVINAAPVPPRQLNPRVPEELERLCLCCLDKDPDRRPTAAELVSELGRLETRVPGELPLDSQRGERDSSNVT